MTQNPLILVKYRGVCLFHSIYKCIVQQKRSQQFVRVYNCQIDKVKVLHNMTALTSVKSMLTKARRDIVLETSKDIFSIDNAGGTLKFMVVQYRGGGKRTEMLKKEEWNREIEDTCLNQTVDN